MLETEQSTPRTTKQNVLKGLGGRGSQTLPCGSQGSLCPATQGVIQSQELSCTPLGICSESISGAWEK